MTHAPKNHTTPRKTQRLQRIQQAVARAPESRLKSLAMLLVAVRDGGTRRPETRPRFRRRGDVEAAS